MRPIGGYQQATPTGYEEGFYERSGQEENRQSRSFFLRQGTDGGGARDGTRLAKRAGKREARRRQGGETPFQTPSSGKHGSISLLSAIRLPEGRCTLGSVFELQSTQRTVRFRRASPRPQSSGRDFRCFSKGVLMAGVRCRCRRVHPGGRGQAVAASWMPL